jgi:hypothetical protein
MLQLLVCSMAVVWWVVQEGIFLPWFRWIRNAISSIIALRRKTRSLYSAHFFAGETTFIRVVLKVARQASAAISQLDPTNGSGVCAKNLGLSAPIVRIVFFFPSPIK